MDPDPGAGNADSRSVSAVDRQSGAGSDITARAGMQFLSGAGFRCIPEHAEGPGGIPEPGLRGGT